MSKRIKTGCLFGSFNPIHNGHLMVAQYMATQTDLDKVELVVSPQNPLKEGALLAEGQYRLEMTRLAIEDNPLLSVNDIEFNLSRPSFTIQTLTELSLKHPDREFVLIMGSDNLAGFTRWKEWERILDEYSCYVYMRPDEDPGELSSHPGVTIYNAPSIYLSSTYIRESLANGYSTKYLVPDKVKDFIKAHKIYVNS